VSWFGEGLPPMPAEQVGDQTEGHRKTAESAESAESAQPRQTEPAEEALAGAGLYPAWPWKPQS
jgi:hypothetical protein